MTLEHPRKWLLLATIAPVIGIGAMLLMYSRWQASGPKSNFLGGEHPVSECLKVSDFYSVQLTTYFLEAARDGGRDDMHKAIMFVDHCDRIPGPGKVIFTIDLMESDTREQPAVLSLLRYDSGGQLTLVKALPPNLHPQGVLRLDATIVEKGKYLLELAFGEARTMDDVIAMPIFVGE